MEREKKVNWVWSLMIEKIQSEGLMIKAGGGAALDARSSFWRIKANGGGFHHREKFCNN